MFPVNGTPASRAQLRIDFEPAITEQFRSLRECVAAVVYSSRAGLGGCAAACDVSPSTLTKMLNRQKDDENERHLPVDFITIIIGETKDIRPLLWLAAKFLPDDASRQEAVLARVEQLLPAMTEAMSLFGQLKRPRR